MTFNKNNVFYKNRMDIKKISNQYGGDIHVATRQWAIQSGVKWTADEMDEWNTIQRRYIQHPSLTLADLFK